MLKAPPTQLEIGLGVSSEHRYQSPMYTNEKEQRGCAIAILVGGVITMVGVMSIVIVATGHQAGYKTFSDYCCANPVREWFPSLFKPDAPRL
jgi:hypothetical protein